MSKQTKNKRKKLKINNSGIKTIKLDKKAMAREANEVKKKLVSYLDDFLYCLNKTEDKEELFDSIIENRDFLRKAAVVAMGTKFFQDSKVKFQSLLDSYKSEHDTNEKRSMHVFSILLGAMSNPPEKSLYYATIILTAPALGYFVQEYLTENQEKE